MKSTLVTVVIALLASSPVLALESLPLYFAQNQGQMNEEVSFYVQGDDRTLYFTSQGLTFSFQGHAVKLDFVDASPGVEPEGQDRRAAVLSYFHGNRDDWKTGIPTFGKIIYPDLWPGIDLVYSGNTDQLKYAFIVHPGADPEKIRLRYRGVTSLSIKDTGALEVASPVETFEDGVPLALQDEDEVSMRYQLLDDMSFGFALGDYDAAKTLTLDPTIVMYCGYIGGSSTEAVTGVAVDGDGNLYMAGSTTSDELSFPVAAGPDLTHNGSRDVFVAKVDPDGLGLIYCGYIGGDDWDVATGIALDSQGCAYVAGSTFSTEATFPVLGGPDLTHNGMEDGFVAKVKADGTELIYCGYVGGMDEDWCAGIALDGDSAVVTGGTASTEMTFPVLGGPDLDYNGGGDLFVAKVKADGTELEYCGYVGGTDTEYGMGVDVDAGGRACISGYTWSTEASFPVAEGPALTHGGESDGFVARVKADGTALEYCGFLGGDSYDYIEDIAVDSDGSAYVTGETWSEEATFPVKVGPDLSFNGNLYDAFVAKVKADGSELEYCGYIGGALWETGFGVTVDADGQAYVTGYTSSTEASFPVTSSWDLKHNGLDDAFVAKVKADGSALDYCGYLGGELDEYGYAVAVDNSGNTYVAGQTYSTPSTFPVRTGPYLAHNGGSYDAFVARILLADKLTCDTYELPETGGTVNFFLDAGSGFSGRNYMVLGSASGVAPGIPLPGGLETMPLVWDPITDVIFSMANTPFFSNFVGKLDGSGTGAAQLNIPALPAGYTSVKIFFAFTVSNPFDFASNPVEIEIVP
jgi:hypothetical protein